MALRFKATSALGCAFFLWHFYFYSNPFIRLFDYNISKI